MKNPLIEHVRRAIAANRRPGLHYPGFHLELEAIDVSQEGSHFAMANGPHCADADGGMNICAIALLADMGMGAAMRVHLPEVSRMATATMQLHFTGLRAKTDLQCRGQFDGFFQGAQATQGRVSGKITAGEDIICHGSATFATPPAPPGVVVRPVPWDSMGPRHTPPPLPVAEMDEDEKRILKAAKSALKKATPEHSFIEYFWAQLAKHKEGGATNSLKFGPHVGNRVGHMQGGVIFGVAAATAAAAVPGSLMTSASAWYISPGTGDKLSVKSTVLQSGRTIAVVRTEVLSGKRLVLAMMTSHTF